MGIRDMKLPKRIDLHLNSTMKEPTAMIHQAQTVKSQQVNVGGKEIGCIQAPVPPRPRLSNILRHPKSLAEVLQVLGKQQA